MSPWILAVWLLFCASSAQVPAAPNSDADLYSKHDWFGLKVRVDADRVKDPLFVGAVAAAFREDEKAIKTLSPLVEGKSASDAQSWLSYIDIRNGHYRS